MNDPELWKLIAVSAVIALGGLLGIIWQSLNKKIDEVRAIATSALTKDEFERELAQSLRDRENLQKDVRELFSKVETTKDLMNERVEAARRGMSEDIKQLRADMNGGFNSLREVMLNIVSKGSK